MAAAGMIGIALQTAQAAAPAADTVMSNLVQNVPTPRSFTAATSLDLKQRDFPWAKISLQGTSYFEAPDRLAIKFSNVPGYMVSVPQAYAKILNVGAWPQRYNVQAGEPQTFNGHTDYTLVLTPKAGGSDRGVALVDPSSWTVERVQWNLSGGVQLTMTENYTHVDSYRVPASQQVSLHTPYATADGTATMRDYVVNVPISGDVFSRQK